MSNVHHFDFCRPICISISTSVAYLAQIACLVHQHERLGTHSVNTDLHCNCSGHLHTSGILQRIHFVIVELSYRQILFSSCGGVAAFPKSHNLGCFNNINRAIVVSPLVAKLLQKQGILYFRNTQQHFFLLTRRKAPYWALSSSPCRYK